MVVGAGQLIVMRQGGMVRPACQSAARETGLTTIGLLGSDGGLALAQCDLAVIVPSEITGRIQESHITAGHALMELIQTH